jgi:hypothetical protein
MDVFLEKVLPALLGLTAGIAGSLIAPWIHWGIDQRRSKMEFRRSQLQRWREFMNSEFDELTFNDSTYYSEMRPHLGRETLETIEGNTITFREGRGGNIVRSFVLDDLAELEKKWELI